MSICIYKEYSLVIYKTWGARDVGQNIFSGELEERKKKKKKI